MGAPTISNVSYGFPAQLASKVENLIPNQQGDSVYITAAAGDTIVAYAIGLKSLQPFDQLPSGTSLNPAYFPGLLSFNANPVVTDSSPDSATITASQEASAVLTLTSVDASIGTTAVYHGTITGGGSNDLVGYYFTVAGFVGANNDGFFICTASTAATLTLANAAATLETHAATATDYVVTITAANNFNVGDVVTFSGLTFATFLNGQSAAVVTIVGGGTGFTVSDPTLHGTSAFHVDAGTASRNSGNDWTIAANLNLADSDYTVVTVPPPGGSPYPSAKWSIDGYYPSVYVFVSENVSAGTYKVTLNSCYNSTTVRPGGLAAGKPIFDGGVNFGATVFHGMGGATADGSATAVSTANPAVTAPIVTTGSGDLVFVVGLQKNANGLGLGTDVSLTSGYSMVSNGKLVGSQAHFLVEWGIQTASGSYTPQFANPLGYETILAAIAIKHT